MPIENIMQTFKTNEKEMLIESMEKLIEFTFRIPKIFKTFHSHIYERRGNQEEIFKSLSLHDLEKMFKNMTDPNSALRKTSMRFLCELLYDNFSVQMLFCELTGIVPMKGKICLNKIPDTFLGFYKELPELLDSIKNSSENEFSLTPLCWFCNPEKIHLKAQSIEHFYPNDVLELRKKEDFVDPMYHLIGFVIKQDVNEEQVGHQESSKFTDYNTVTSSEQGQGQMKTTLKSKKPENIYTSKTQEKSKSPFNKSSKYETNLPSDNSKGSIPTKTGIRSAKIKDECQTARPFDKNPPKTANDIYYRTADKALNVEVQKISLVSSIVDDKSITMTDYKDQSRNNSKKRDIPNPRTRLLSPQMVPDKKKNGFNLISTSYHMAAPPSNRNPVSSSKIKDIRKQNNNFMSIVESKNKDDGKSNPKSQSVLQDYNIKYEKKPNETTSNVTATHMKKKSNADSKQTTVLSKLIKGHQTNYRTEQNHSKLDENTSKKEENSKIKMMNDSFGKYNTEQKNSLEIEEAPEHELNEEAINEMNASQQNNGSIVNTPRINNNTNDQTQKEKENILIVRKSHELGSSYYNQHIKKKSFEINPGSKTIDDSKYAEKDKKGITNLKNKTGNNFTTVNSNKTKENRSLTPNSKEQIKFEGKIKKSVQRQFIKTAELKEEKKTTVIRKK